MNRIILAFAIWSENLVFLLVHTRAGQDKVNRYRRYAYTYIL